MTESSSTRGRLTRRGFLKTAGAAAGVAGLAGVASMATADGWLAPASAEAAPEEHVVRTYHQSHCGGMCSLACTVRDGRMVKVQPNGVGNPDFQTICLKGISEVAHIYGKGRVQTPLKRVGERGSGQFEPISWDEALDYIAAEMKKAYAGRLRPRLHHGAGHRRGRLRFPCPHAGRADRRFRRHRCWHRQRARPGHGLRRGIRDVRPRGARLAALEARAHRGVELLRVEPAQRVHVLRRQGSRRAHGDGRSALLHDGLEVRRVDSHRARHRCGAVFGHDLAHHRQRSCRRGLHGAALDDAVPRRCRDGSAHPRSRGDRAGR